jgi:hypothetical protein
VIVGSLSDVLVDPPPPPSAIVPSIDSLKYSFFPLLDETLALAI